MAIDPGRVYTRDERAGTRYRCPSCNTSLALTWRRARRSGRSEDLWTIAKTSCPNRCNYDRDDI